MDGISQNEILSTPQGNSSGGAHWIRFNGFASITHLLSPCQTIPKDRHADPHNLWPEWLLSLPLKAFRVREVKCRFVSTLLAPDLLSSE